MRLASPQPGLRGRGQDFDCPSRLIPEITFATASRRHAVALLFEYCPPGAIAARCSSSRW